MEPAHKEDCQISAIVPAYNEAANILTVLEEIRKIRSISEILVICDGCTDDTYQQVMDWGNAELVNLPTNQGKTRAVLAGVRQAKHDLVLLCDADLKNLQADDLIRMIGKYLEGYGMVIMEIGSQPWFFRNLLKSQPAVSGTRLLPKRHIEMIHYQVSDRYKFEVRVNDYFIREGLSIGISPAPDVHDLRKYRKYPFWEGLALDIRCAVEVLTSDGLAKMVKVLRNFRRIAANT